MIHRSFSSSVFVLAATLVATASGAPAGAQPPVVVTARPDPIALRLPFMRVSYRDLRLENASDSAILRKRVKRAVSIVCADGFFESRDYPAVRICNDETGRVAAADVNRAIDQARELASNGSSTGALIVVASR